MWKFKKTTNIFGIYPSIAPTATIGPSPLIYAPYCLLPRSLFHFDYVPSPPHPPIARALFYPFLSPRSPSLRLLVPPSLPLTPRPRISTPTGMDEMALCPARARLPMGHQKCEHTLAGTARGVDSGLGTEGHDVSQDSVGIRGPPRGGDRERPGERQARLQEDDDAGGSGLGTAQPQGKGTARRPGLPEGREGRLRRRATTHVPRPVAPGGGTAQGLKAEGPGADGLGAPVTGNRNERMPRRGGRPPGLSGQRGPRGRGL